METYAAPVIDTALMSHMPTVMDGGQLSAVQNIFNALLDAPTSDAVIGGLAVAASPVILRRILLIICIDI